MDRQPDLLGARPRESDVPRGPSDESPWRVLVLSADMGGGHDATAAGLEEAVRDLWPHSEVQRLNTLGDLLPPSVGALFRRIYVSNVESTPWLYEFFYSSLWRHRWFARASKTFTGVWCAGQLGKRVDAFDPDLILSTYPLATSGLEWLRRHRGLSVPAAAWISDFAPHPFWVYRDIDANFVMHEASVAHARAAEPDARIAVCRPPVVRSFAPGDKQQARTTLGLRADAFIVLVTCGAYAFGDTYATVRALLDAAPEVQVVAACGRNTETRSRLSAMGEPTSRLLPMGWTDNMAEYVRAADVVLTNAGGASALEALAATRPILMNRPIAAHGAANAQLMVVSGLADVCADEQRLTDYIRTAVADPQALESLDVWDDDTARDLPSILRELVSPRTRPPEAGRGWPLRPEDAFFAHVDAGGNRQEVGAVLELGPLHSGDALDLATLEQVVSTRAPALPPLRRRLSARGRPGWLLDESLDIRRHVREAVLPPRALDTAADDLVDGFWSEALPPGRPAWQMLLVRGLPGGRAVLAVKMHHSLGDGISALGTLDRLLLDPAPGDELRERQSRPVAPTAPGNLRGAVHRGGLVVRGLASLAVRGAPPHHPLNHGPALGGDRCFISVPLPEAQLRDAARRLHAHPQEVVLAVLADGVGQALAGAGLVPEPATLRVMVPLAMRAPRLDRVFGNWTGVAALDLPLHPMPTSRRVAAVRTELRRRVRRGEPAAAQAVMRVAGLLPSPVHAWFARTVYTRRFFSTIATYMPGPRGPRWCAGAPVLGIHPVLPLTAGVPLTMGAILSGDTLGVGILHDPHLGLDRTDVAAAILRAFDTAVAEGAGQPPTENGR